MNSGDRRLTPAALQSFRLTKHQLVNEKSEKDGLSPIMAAATNGHVDVVRCLVKNGANINDVNPDGQTPLILAAKNGFHPLFRLLVNYGAKLDIQDARGRTALMYALAEGGLEMARCLIDAGASHKPVDREGKTALFVAAECGHVAIVEHLLIDSGVDLGIQDRQGRTVLMMLARAGKAWSVYKYIEERLLRVIINDRDFAGWTPLLHAAEAGKFSMAGRLVGWGADPKAVTLDGQTVVMLACQRTQLHCASADADFCADASGAEAWDQKAFVSAMLERGVALDAVDKSGRTALFYAVEHAQLEMVRHLLTLHAGLLKPDSRDAKANSVLHAAARMGRESMVRFLLDLPELAILVEEPNSDGDVPLRLAIMSKCLRTVKALIESGASLEMADSCRDPPLLCLASEYGAEEIVDFLLCKKYSPDSADSEGVTALMAATRSDHIGIVERLLRASANVNLYNSKGFTALTLAVQTINIAICKSLLKRKADPNLLPEGKTDCKTACSIAATLGNCVLIELLLKYDANAFLKDPQGRNALYYCVLMGRVSPLKCLAKWAVPDELDEYFPHDGQQHTLMTIAAERGYLEVAKLLLQNQASLDAKSSLGESSLHIACRRQDRVMVEVFLTYTLKFSCPRDSDQFTPLMIVCQLGNKDIALELCSKGADVNARTPDGYTALILSISACKTPMDRLPLISILLENGAKYDGATDEKLLGSEGWNLLMTLCRARSAGASAPALPALMPPPQAQAQAKDKAKLLKVSSAMKVEERLKIKLKNKQLQPMSSDKQEGETTRKGSLAVRSNKIREEMRSSVDVTDKSVRRLATMVKKHLESCALPDPLNEASGTKLAMDMNKQDITRLYRRPFSLTSDQMNQNKLVRDFSLRMDQIRKEIVRKFEEKLDMMCRRRPKKMIPARCGKLAANKQASGSVANSPETASEAPIKHRKRRRVQLRVLYQLKYESKAAKPRNGLRPVLLRRLMTLKAAAVSSRRGRKWTLSLFWEQARVRNLLGLRFVPRMRRLLDAVRLGERELLGQFTAMKLEGLAVAMDEATIWWAPLPALSNSGESGDAASPWWTWLSRKHAPKGTRQDAPLRRLLKHLASDGSRCSLLLRCGQRPNEVKLAMDWADRERQIDMSCAIQAAPFQSTRELPPGRRPDAVVKLSVNTSRCLWDARELRALSDVLASVVGDKDHDATWGHRRCLDTLTRRQTHQLLSPSGSGKPQELELVALHPALSTKLIVILLHAKLNKNSSAPYTFHGDDILLYQQPGQKELKYMLGMLGPDRVKLFETHRFN